MSGRTTRALATDERRARTTAGRDLNPTPTDDPPEELLSGRGDFWASGPTTLALRTCVIAVFLGLWQLAYRYAWIDPFFISSPTLVAERLRSWVGDGAIYSHTLTTLREALIGFIIGAASGVLIGFALGYSKIATRVFLPIINMLNTLPRVALAPMFILWFGIGEESKIFLVFTVVVVILIFNTYSGLQTVDADTATNAKLLGASSWSVLWKVTFPWCLPWIFAGLRIALAWAVGAAVIGEYLAASEGLGYLIFQYSGVLDQTGVLAGCAVLLIISGVLFGILDAVENYVLRWRPDTR